MSSVVETARQFFEACETGQGWEVCQDFCHPEATFSCQSGALADVSTLDAYCEWMKGLLTPIPDAHYDLRFFGADESTNSVTAVGVFRGTQTGEGGPVPPTGNSVASDYVYHMEFEGDRISHMTKIWNDTIGLQQLGWA